MAIFRQCHLVLHLYTEIGGPAGSLPNLPITGLQQTPSNWRFCSTTKVTSRHYNQGIVGIFVSLARVPSGISSLPHVHIISSVGRPSISLGCPKPGAAVAAGAPCCDRPGALRGSGAGYSRAQCAAGSTPRKRQVGGQILARFWCSE